MRHLTVIVAAFVLLIILGDARADTFLDVNGLSFHSEKHYRYQGRQYEFNGVNPGIGTTMSRSEHLDLKAGVFFNSYSKVSVYSGINVKKCFAWNNFTLAPGITAMLVTGYANTPVHSGFLLPVIFPNVGIRYGDAGVVVGYIPGTSLAKEANPVSTVTVQFQYRLR